MWVGTTALILLAPIMNRLRQFTVLMSVKSARVDMILDIPFLVLSDKTLNQHFVTLA